MRRRSSSLESNDFPTRALHVGMEALLLAMVVLSPWAFAAVEPVFELVLYALPGVLVLLSALAAGQDRTTSALSLPGGPLPSPASSCSRLDSSSPCPPRSVPGWRRTPWCWRESFCPSIPRCFRGRRSRWRPPHRPLDRSASTRKLPVTCWCSYWPFSWCTFWCVTKSPHPSRCAASPGSACSTAPFWLLGIAQSLSSPRNVVYWSIATQGAVLGPFICRNHYPFYLNLCIGLAQGLLRPPRPDAAERQAPEDSALARAQEFLLSPGVVASATKPVGPRGPRAMLASVPLCCAGGSSLLGAALLCLVLGGRYARTAPPGIVPGPRPPPWR